MEGKVSERYTAQEFAECYALRGYGRKRDALNWLAERGMDTATEDDFQRCYDYTNKQVIWPRNSRYIALGSDGWNPSAPQHQPNSRGESFSAMMRRAQQDLDRAEKAMTAAGNALQKVADAARTSSDLIRQITEADGTVGSPIEQ